MRFASEAIRADREIRLIAVRRDPAVPRGSEQGAEIQRSRRRASVAVDHPRRAELRVSRFPISSACAMKIGYFEKQHESCVLATLFLSTFFWK